MKKTVKTVDKTSETGTIEGGIYGQPVTPNMPASLSWPHDLVEAMKNASKKLKRDDIDLAILLSPSKATQYAIRLGGSDATWIKNINPLEFLDLLNMPAKEVAGRAQEAHAQRDYYDTTIHLTEEISQWMSSKPEEVLPGETLKDRFA